MLKQPKGLKTKRAPKQLKNKSVVKKIRPTTIQKRKFKPTLRKRSSPTPSNEATNGVVNPRPTLNAQGKPLTLVDFKQEGPTSLFQQNLYYVHKSIFTHKGYDIEDMKQIKVAHFTPQTTSDRIALRALKVIRGTFDLVTGYTHPPKGEELNPKYKMSTNQWMIRFIFLESVAGVPGFVGGMVRHLQSIRLLKRDNGWIETLLEESYNERLHLLSFLELHKPGYFMKTMILGAQGVFFNALFMEEEAVVTYTRCLKEIDAGFYPEWTTTQAPSIARAYWKMPEDAKINDMLQYILADEAKHREVNHTFANLNHNDPNPYSMPYDNDSHPSHDLKSNISHPVGWPRNEIEVSAALNPYSPEYAEQNIKH